MQSFEGEKGLQTPIFKCYSLCSNNNNKALIPITYGYMSSFPPFHAIQYQVTIKTTVFRVLLRWCRLNNSITTELEVL